jgi:hypothetical protein
MRQMPQPSRRKTPSKRGLIKLSENTISGSSGRSQQWLSTHMLNVGKKVHPVGQLSFGEGNARHTVVIDGVHTPDVGDAE